MHICSLCSKPVLFIFRFRERDYYRCSSCRAVMIDPLMHISPEDEKIRYDQHNNDINDPGYRQFVKPLVESVKNKFSVGTKGLDYGAGSGPVAADLLVKLGYEIKLFDPFYWNNPEVLTNKYDFIICCEVIEHFCKPYDEFKLLHSLLRPHGSLFCMTEILRDDLNLEEWYYLKDPTHIFFYHRQTFEWIRGEFSFSSLDIKGRIIKYNL